MYLSVVFCAIRINTQILYIHICTCVFWTVLTCLSCAYLSLDTDKIIFFTGESNNIDKILVFINGSTVWKLTHKHTAFHLISQIHYLMDWSHVGCLFIMMTFVSAVWNLILMAPINCRGSIGEHVMLFLQICSDEVTSSSAPWMAWGYIFRLYFIRKNYSFKQAYSMQTIYKKSTLSWLFKFLLHAYS